MRTSRISCYTSQEDFDLVCRRTLHSNQLDTPGEHKHYFYELVVVCAGTGVHRTGGRDYALVPGSIFLIPPHQTHCYVKYCNLEIFNLVFSRSFFRFLLPDVIQLPGFQLLFKADTAQFAKRPNDGIRIDPAAFPEIIALLTEMDDLNYSERPGCKSLLLSDFIRVMLLIAQHANWTSGRGSSQHVGALTGVLAALEENCLDDWPLARMAKLANMSISSFGQEFRKLTGSSPINYLLKMRLERAAFLLETTHLPMEQIALECGFLDRSYFSRQFLKQYAVRPSRYRNELPRRLQDAHNNKGF